MGRIDLHVHAGPSVMPRALDGAEMLREATAAGYAGFVIKDHYFPTMMSAQLLEKHLGDGTCRVFGGLALNRSVGGINLKAVDAACAMGARIIWMPTVSALRHKEMHQGHGLAFPGSRGMTVEEETIYYLDGQGALKPEVLAVLDYLKERPQVILATGHGSRDEVDALVRRAAEVGISRILVNHPHYMIGASLEDMVSWSRLGAYIELNATVFVPDSKFCTNDIREAGDILRAVGPGKIVLDSDYGQTGNGSPVAGVDKMICLMQSMCGMTEEEVIAVTETNPAWLLNI